MYKELNLATEYQQHRTKCYQEDTCAYSLKCDAVRKKTKHDSHCLIDDYDWDKYDCEKPHLFHLCIQFSWCG